MVVVVDSAVISAVMMTKRRYREVVEETTTYEEDRQRKIDEEKDRERLSELLVASRSPHQVHGLLTLQFYRMMHAEDEQDPAFNIDVRIVESSPPKERRRYTDLLISLREKAHENELDD